MQLFDFASLREYEKTMLRFYREDPLFKNNKSGTLRIVCNPKGAFYQNTAQRMIGVRKNGEILCQCVLIKHKVHDAVSVSFFEAQQNCAEAVDLMMSAAADFGKMHGAKRLEIALDGHCNYGVGFSYGPPERPPLFGESYNHGYYHDFFINGYRKVGFTSYSDSLENIAAKIGAYKNRGDITIEAADFRHFPDTMKRYTDLSNAIFTNHRYCFQRDYAEDLELFSGMKLLLAPNNLLFARKAGKDIGFLLMYPDFNELVQMASGAGVDTYIRYKIWQRPVRTMKIAEIGVLPEFQTGWAVLLLFAQAIRQTKQHYPRVENVVSSWILDENIKSRAMVSRIAPNIHKRYAAYEKQV